MECRVNLSGPTGSHVNQIDLSPFENTDLQQTIMKILDFKTILNMKFLSQSFNKSFNEIVIQRLTGSCDLLGISVLYPEKFVTYINLFDLTNVDRINLRECNVDDALLNVLFVKFSKLKHLYLNNCKVIDLKCIKKFTALENFECIHSNFSSLFTICSLGDVSSLKMLNLDSSSNIRLDLILYKFKNLSFIDNKGNKYTGDLENGSMHGQGTLIRANGNRYVGNFEKNKYHGRGILTSTEGIVEGNFIGGHLCGYGTYTYPNGDKYEGNFDNSYFHGHGTFTFVNGLKYEGNFKEGRPYGKVTVTEADGEKHEKIF